MAVERAADVAVTLGKHPQRQRAHLAHTQLQAPVHTVAAFHACGVAASCLARVAASQRWHTSSVISTFDSASRLSRASCCSGVVSEVAEAGAASAASRSMPKFAGTNFPPLRATKPVPPHGSHGFLTPGAASPQKKPEAIQNTPQTAHPHTLKQQARPSSQDLHGCVPSASLFSFSSYWKQHICATRPRR